MKPFIRMSFLMQMRSVKGLGILMLIMGQRMIMKNHGEPRAVCYANEGVGLAAEKFWNFSERVGTW